MSNLDNAEINHAVVPQERLPLSASQGASPGSDSAFRHFFENSPDAIVIADDEGRYLDANAAACDLFGYPREQMLHLRVGDLVTVEPPEAAERYALYLQRGQETGIFTFVRPDNDRRITSYSACRLGPGRHLSVLRDITEQRREQEKSTEDLARQARLFDTTLSSIVDFAYVFDREGRFTYVNQALLNLWQRDLAEALGKNFFELDYPPELAARLQEQIRSVFDTGQTLRDETPYTGAAGITGYYEYIFVPVFGTDGEVEVVAGSTRDITARHQEKKEREELLQTLEIERARLTDLFMQAPAFIAVLRGPQHVFERVNPPYLHLAGERDLLGKSVREAFPDMEGQGFLELLDEVYRTGKPFIGKEMRILFQEGEGAPLRRHYIDFVYQPLIEADGSVSGIFVHGVDLTERKQANEALRERQEEIEVLDSQLRRAMTETHHRVKNNLQLISSLIEMQKQSGQEMVPMSEIVRLGQNIQALGVIHDILTSEAKKDGEAAWISVKGVLEQFLPLLQSTLGKRRLLTRMEELSLPGKQATSLALVVNELVSNAVKHGTGDVELTLGMGGNTATLEVCDDGAGFPAGFDPATAAHTGLELIENIARYDLRARDYYENRPEGGARVVLIFPIQLHSADA